MGYSNLYPHPLPPVEEPENSMEGGIFRLEILGRGLKILTKCWKFHGGGVNSVGNSMGGR